MRGYRWRTYQVDAGWRAFCSMSKGRCVALNLPTGTGKTIIANYVSLWWYLKNPRARGLYVVPRRILVQQHRQYARWLPREIQAVELTERDASNGFELERRVKRVNLVITTPGLLAGTLSRGLWNASLQESFAYVIVDEFDEFLLFEYGESGGIARFDQSFAHFLDEIGSGYPTLLLSATSPLAATRAGNAHPVVIALANLTRKTYRPVEIEIPEQLLKGHLPAARIHLVSVFDPSVRAFDEAIRNEKRWCLDTLSHDHKILIDEDYVLTRLEGLLSGRIQRLRFLTGGRRKWQKITLKDRRLLGRLRLTLSLFDFVFEDLSSPLFVEERSTWHLVSGEGFNSRIDLRLRLSEGFSSGNTEGYQPRLAEKWNSLLLILARHQNAKGVIFLRYLRMANRIAGELSKLGWPIIQIDGECDDDERRVALERFQRETHLLLVITRGTGKRGLDLPQAKFAIFYSPKAEENTMWQELSRIRGTVEKAKISYLLYYSGTAEAEKTRRLITQMGVSGRRYKFEGLNNLAL